MLKYFTGRKAKDESHKNLHSFRKIKICDEIALNAFSKREVRVLHAKRLLELNPQNIDHRFASYNKLTSSNLKNFDLYRFIFMNI